MTRNEQRLVLIFLIVAATGLIFLFLNRYRFYYNYIKIALHEGGKSAVTAGDDSTDTGKRNGADDAERGKRAGETSTKAEDGRAAAAGGKSSGGTGGRAAGSGRPSGKVDINNAGLDELMSLPGIGRVTALNIIEYRTRTGGFADVQGLIEVQGIGRKKLDAVLEYVVAE
jgi:competence ComEA-like helix-hairpin-helix protein